ncbi:hypothetical protein [Bradyrhizobium diazoefficiens]
MFRRHARTELIVNIAHGYFSLVRAALGVFRAINNICHIIAGAICFGVALFITMGPAQHAPIWNIVAFLVGWFGVALACEGLDGLASGGERKDARQQVLTGHVIPLSGHEQARRA